MKLLASSTVLALAATLTGCTASQLKTVSDITGSSTVQSEAVASAHPDRSRALVSDVAENLQFTADELKPASGIATQIQFDQDDSNISGAQQNSVHVDGNVLTIGSTGSYRVSGHLSGGQIIVNAPQSSVVTIVLNGADITASTASALNIQHAGKVVIELEKGSRNRLSGGAESGSRPQEHKATIQSQAPLVITGAGSLEVEGGGGDGISSDGGLVLAGGDVVVRAPAHGLSSEGLIVMIGGNYTVTASTDGLLARGREGRFHQYAGQLNISAGQTGVAAQDSVKLSGGSLLISESVVGVSGRQVDVVATNSVIFAERSGMNAQSTMVTTANSVSRQEERKPDGVELKMAGGQMSIVGSETALASDGNVDLSGGMFVVAEQGSDSSSLVSARGQLDIGETGIALVSTGEQSEVGSAKFGVPKLRANLSAVSGAGSAITVVDSQLQVVASFPVNIPVESLQFINSKLHGGAEYQIYVGARQKVGSIFRFDPSVVLLGAGKAEA